MDMAVDNQDGEDSIFSPSDPHYDRDMKLKRADRLELESSDFNRKERGKSGGGNKCFSFIVGYLILLTAVSGYLFYKVFMLQNELHHNTDGSIEIARTSSFQNGNPLGAKAQTSNGGKDHFPWNTSLETTSLRKSLGTLQARVEDLCEGPGGLGQLRAELGIVNASTVHLQNELLTLNLRPGPPGAPGPQGPKGDTGSEGSKGDPGEQGPPGDPGAPGEKGHVGSEGGMGQTGPPGERGNPGSPGAPGRTGITGPPGGDGVKGEAGSPGTSGPTGVPGPPGMKGEQGLKGDKGLIGQKGSTGIQGPPGPRGLIGQNGWMGAKGDRGSKGDRGDRGPKGETGLPGIPGPREEKREKGFACQRSSIVRLAGGGSRGRVEVFIQGAWGTICDDNFDTSDGTVICKMLGYARASNTFTATAGTGKILLDNLACTGRESSFLQCPHGGLGVHDCSHSEDAGVTCV